MVNRNSRPGNRNGLICFDNFANLIEMRFYGMMVSMPSLLLLKSVSGSERNYFDQMIVELIIKMIVKLIVKLIIKMIIKMIAKLSR